MVVLWVYFILYLTSIVYLVTKKEEIEKESLPYSNFIFIIVVIVMSSILLGTFLMIEDIRMWIKGRLIVGYVKLVLWKIKRKYKIK